MLVGLVAGLVVGLAASVTGSPILHTVAAASAPVGLGDTRTLGRLGGVSLGFILATTAPAVVMGMAAMHLVLGWVPPVPLPEVAIRPDVAELPGIVDFIVGLI